MDTEPTSEFVLQEDKLQAEDEPPSSSNKISGFNSMIVKPIGQPLNGSGSGTITASPHSIDFLQKFYPKSGLHDWNNWRWQIRQSIRSIPKLKKFLNLSTDEFACSDTDKVNLPIRITPYYLSLLSKSDAKQALRRSVIPVKHELFISAGENLDPLCEGHSSPIPNLVHRYPDRVLFLISGFCATYCRYCTRSHMVAQDDKLHLGKSMLEPAFRYIESHHAIRDVILSGGDPLTLTDSYLEYILLRLRSIPHVEIIRIGTKVPAVLPQRITKELVEMLGKYHPLFMSLHFTHPDEITPEVAQATARLANAGIPLGSQTVLLKNINDDVQTMKTLMLGMLKLRVRPYYLYQCDPVPGSAQFRTPVEKGLEIIEGLRGHTSGYAVPHFVIDAPGGGGKIPLLPEYYLRRDDNGNVLLRNFENKVFKYPEAP